MPAPRKITNVKSLLERTERFCEELMNVNGNYDAKLGEAFIQEANGIRFMCKTILRIHNEKGTRKDIRP
jgi:UDP-2,3-diacylglucosamine pyrophosphatase LpxH